MSTLGRDETMNIHFAEIWRDEVTQSMRNFVDKRKRQMMRDFRNGLQCHTHIILEVTKAGIHVHRTRVSNADGDVNFCAICNEVCIIDSCKDIECSICLDTLRQSDAVMRLNCGHLFHTLCCSLALCQKSTCPLCRAPQ